MAYEGLKDNKNSEIWTLEEAKKLLEMAVETSQDKQYDFIGEVARAVDSYHHIFKYLVNKFPELKDLHKSILDNCEQNCFFNGKKNNIVPSMAIMNLKSNHGWTDRVDQTTKGGSTNDLQKLTDEELDEAIKRAQNGKD